MPVLCAMPAAFAAAVYDYADCDNISDYNDGEDGNGNNSDRILVIY